MVGVFALLFWSFPCVRRSMSTELAFPLITVLFSAVWNLEFSYKVIIGNTNLTCKDLRRTQQLSITIAVLAPTWVTEWLWGTLTDDVFVPDWSDFLSLTVAPPPCSWRECSPQVNPVRGPAVASQPSPTPEMTPLGEKHSTCCSRYCFRWENLNRVILQVLRRRFDGRWKLMEADCGGDPLGPVSVCSGATVHDSDERCDREKWSHAWHLKFSTFLQMQSGVRWRSWQTSYRSMQVQSECLHHRATGSFMTLDPCRRKNGFRWAPMVLQPTIVPLYFSLCLNRSQTCTICTASTGCSQKSCLLLWMQDWKGGFWWGV